MSAIVGLCILLIGIALIKNPLAGVVSLTFVSAFLLIAVGIVRLVWAFKFADGTRWALLGSGIISLLLSVMIFANFPQSAAVMLGVFLAVELISNGTSMTMMAFAKKKMDSQVK